jgi:1,4-alpha-glucan branching enzyme
MRDLNCVYAAHPAFWEKDFTEDGFSWLDCHQEEKRIYAMERRGEEQKLAMVFNFSELEQTYELKVEDAEELKLIMASDRDIYDGTKEYQQDQVYKVEDGAVTLTLSPNSAMYFEIG